MSVAKPILDYIDTISEKPKDLVSQLRVFRQNFTISQAVPSFCRFYHRPRRIEIIFVSARTDVHFTNHRQCYYTG